MPKTSHAHSSATSKAETRNSPCDQSEGAGPTNANGQTLVQVWHTSAVSSPSPAEPIPSDLLQEIAGTFGMLAATARLQILWLLAAEERDVGTLAAEVGQPVATVSHHLAKLKLARLVRVRREGRRQVYLIADHHVAETVQRTVGHYAQLRATPRRGRARGA
jgi:DNA-binding transcriptional ArsR family regulator